MYPFPLPISLNIIIILALLGFMLMFVIQKISYKIPSVGSGISNKLNIVKMVLIVIFIMLMESRFN